MSARLVPRACLIVAALSIAAWLALRSTEAPVSDAATPIAQTATKADVTSPSVELSSSDEPREPAREAVETESSAEFDDAAKREGLALLRVVVVSKETGAPVPAVAVMALEGDMSELTGASIRGGGRGRARPGEAVKTDAKGRAELLVQPYVEHRVHNSGPLPNATYELHYQGAVVRSEGFVRDQLATWVVPAGELELRRVHPSDAPAKTHALTLAAGEARELVIGG